MKRAARRQESGFAMLLVFVMAAVIAISMYYEMPRVAFESQRLREQMAIDRANEYKRAIQLFYRKYQTYPQNLDDLETTRNLRFLRRRYKDPLTGKDWRLVHVGPGGNLTDSAIKQPNPAQNGAPGANGTTAAQGTAGTTTAGTSAAAGTNPNTPQIDPQTGLPVSPGLNMAARRPSDRIIGGGPEVPANPNPQDPNQPQDPSQQQYPQQPQYPGQPGYPAYPGQTFPGQPGQTGTGQPGQPAYPGAPQIPGQPVQYPGQPQPQDPSQPQPFNPQQPAQYPGLPTALPGQPYPGQSGGYPAPITTPPGFAGQSSGGVSTQTTGAPGIPGVPGVPGGQNPALPGANPGGAPGANPAAGLIQQILTTPRQPPSSVNTNAVTGGMTGIAGVGGVADGKGIHVINDHSKYKEWEFIYDIKNDKTAIGAGAVLQNQLLQQQQQQNQQQPNSPFGSQQPNSPGSTTTSSSPTTPAPAPATPPTSQ